MGVEIVSPHPMPKMIGLTREFYEWCAKHQLRFQRCVGCGAFRHPPRELCPTCSDAEWEWIESGGRGRVFTWTTVFRSMHPHFTRTPFAGVVVELAEGPRILSRVTDVAPEDLAFDMTLELDFEDISEGFALPIFKRGSARSDAIDST